MSTMPNIPPATLVEPEEGNGFGAVLSRGTPETEARAAEAAPQTGDAVDRPERVMLLAPTGRDAALLAGQLRRRGFVVDVCADHDDLCRAVRAGCGAAFVAEEALSGSALKCVLDELEHQPAWSDLPVIIMTHQSQATYSGEKLASLFRAVANVTLLQRPIRLVTLVSTIDSALKSRRRQYQARDLLVDLRQAVEQRDRFLAMLGHELRNPLAAVVNAITILRKFGPSDPHLADEQCDVIGRQSTHMARLVDDLLDVARITSGKVVLNREPIDLRVAASRALQALRLSAAMQRRHDIALESPPVPVVVSADAVRLEQVLLNLLTNAVKYTPDGGRVTLAIGVEHGSNGDGAMAVVRVIDSGEGIPAEMLGSIFEPFTQLAQSLARSRGGLGMGLTVVKNLVEMHGGAVSAHSAGPGKGSEFRITLPLAASQAAVARPAPARPAQTNPCEILLVEDNPDSRKTLARLLRLFGHKVDTADDGPAGLEKALAIKPEVALLDIGLPGMDGFEVGRRIRAALGDGILLIALTGYGQPEDRERVREAGFDLHLVKPVQPDQLNAILSARLCGKRGMRGA
ncbi:MAG: ATP-binding protein [Phycisphaerae bacterium]